MRRRCGAFDAHLNCPQRHPRPVTTDTFDRGDAADVLATARQGSFLADCEAAFRGIFSKAEDGSVPGAACGLIGA